MKLETLNYLRSRYVSVSETNCSQPEEPLAICTPFYNAKPFLNEYLFHLTMFDYPRDLMSLYFTVQGNDETLSILEEFERQFKSEYKRIKVKKIKQIKGGYMNTHVRNVVMCRNMLADWSKPDPVLFIDHDNFLPPVSVKRLRENLALGADITAGIYTFCEKDLTTGEPRGRIGFTYFFIRDGKFYHAAIDRAGEKGFIFRELLGKRLWGEGVAMGATMMKREVLNQVKFFTPEDWRMTDDTSFCLKAINKGFKVMGDWGLLVGHWGYHLQFGEEDKNGELPIKVTMDNEMIERRYEMHRQGVYGMDLPTAEEVRRSFTQRVK